MSNVLNDKIIHDLAVVYAQTKLKKYLQDNPNSDEQTEVRLLYGSYINATIQMVADNEKLTIEVKSSSQQ